MGQTDGQTDYTGTNRRTNRLYRDKQTDKQIIQGQTDGQTDYTGATDGQTDYTDYTNRWTNRQERGKQTDKQTKRAQTDGQTDEKKAAITSCNNNYKPLTSVRLFVHPL